jgi:chemotaxis protein CheX
MVSLNEEDLKLFVNSVRHYFSVTTSQEPQITSAFLGTSDIQGYDFNGMITFSGSFNGHVLVSMPGKLLRELVFLQHETDLSDANLLDAVGEIANTLAGNARKNLGSDLQISVPLKLRGSSGIKARVRKQPYVITLRWNHQPALVVVDMERRSVLE